MVDMLMHASFCPASCHHTVFLPTLGWRPELHPGPKPTSRFLKQLYAHLHVTALLSPQYFVGPFCQYPWCACHHESSGLQQMVLSYLVLQQTLRRGKGARHGGGVAATAAWKSSKQIEAVFTVETASESIPDRCQWHSKCNGVCNTNCAQYSNEASCKPPGLQLLQ